MVSRSGFTNKGFACTLLILLHLISYGCATQGVSKVNHRLNVPQKVASERMLDKPYLKVWDDLVEKLSDRFYVINTMDKDSKKIQVSFHSRNPEYYVDCGETTRTYRHGGDVEIYVYNDAESVSYRVADEKRHHPYLSSYNFIKRNTYLDGNSVVYISNNDNNATIIKVNTTYKLYIEVSGQSYSKPSNGNPFVTEKLPARTEMVLFETNSPKTHTFGDGGKITCSSKGTLEKEILYFSDY